MGTLLDAESRNRGRNRWLSVDGDGIGGDKRSVRAVKRGFGGIRCGIGGDELAMCGWFYLSTQPVSINLLTATTHLIGLDVWVRHLQTSRFGPTPNIVTWLRYAAKS